MTRKTLHTFDNDWNSKESWHKADREKGNSSAVSNEVLHSQNTIALEKSITENGQTADKLKQKLFETEGEDNVLHKTIYDTQTQLDNHFFELETAKSNIQKSLIHGKIAEIHMESDDYKQALIHLKQMSQAPLVNALIAYCEKDRDKLKRIYTKTKGTWRGAKNKNEIEYLWQHHHEAYKDLIQGYKQTYQEIRNKKRGRKQKRNSTIKDTFI